MRRLRRSRRLGRPTKDAIPELFERCRQLIAERRERPTDDLTSMLVHAEVEGETLEEREIVMGFFLLMAAGNDSTKATYCSGMRALLHEARPPAAAGKAQIPDQRGLLVEDPSLIPAAVEESLRMFPAFAHFAHFARTATRDTELAGQRIREGERVVMWYVSSGRDEGAHTDPDRFDCAAIPGTRRSGRAAATSASAPRWRGSNCACCSRRRSRAFRTWSWRASRRGSSRRS
jgi:cytochrome P450